MTTQRVHLRAEAMQMRDMKLVLRGDPFTAPVEEADALVAMNFASRVVHQEDDAVTEDAVPVRRKPSLSRRITKEDGAKQEPGKYRRRDLRAEA